MLAASPYLVPNRLNADSGDPAPLTGMYLSKTDHSKP
jgi:hypothetical protein